MQQDELARLFSANMKLSHTQAPPVQPVQQSEPEPEPEPEQAPKHIVYASQHYTHSHHVPLRSASEPVLKTQINESDLEAILVRNSIDPTLLFPSQIDLFRNADDDQRLRLLELWRISPPSGRQGHPAGTDYNMSRQLYDWPPTSLAQEEAMAKLRFERQQAEDTARQNALQQQQEQQQEQEQSMVVASAEPYMSSGYEMMAMREYEESARAQEALKEASRYNQATDPVYNTGNGLWQKNVGSVIDMENNYGAYAFAREYGLQASYGDEEMVM
jgi:hypothetical protein